MTTHNTTGEAMRFLDATNGLLRTRGSFRRITPDIRSQVANAFVDKVVSVVDRYGRKYSGKALAVARPTDGHLSDVLVVSRDGYWPVAISLAIIDEIGVQRA